MENRKIPLVLSHIWVFALLLLTFHWEVNAETYRIRNIQAKNDSSNSTAIETIHQNVKIELKTLMIHMEVPNRTGLTLAQPMNACELISTLPTSPVSMHSNDKLPKLEWALLISWGSDDDCSIQVKVGNAIKAGYKVLLFPDYQSSDSVGPHFDFTSNWSNVTVFAATMDPMKWDFLKNHTVELAKTDYIISISKLTVYEERDEAIMNFLISAVFPVVMGLSILTFVIGNIVMFVIEYFKPDFDGPVWVRPLHRRRLKSLNLYKFETHYSKESGQVNINVTSDTSDDSCIVCLELLILEKDSIGTLPCSHRFHYKCIKKWMEKSFNCCPVCRDLVMTPLSVKVTVPATSNTSRVNNPTEETGLLMTPSVP